MRNRRTVHHRQAARHQAGHRHPGRGSSASSCSRAADPMALRKRKPTSPARRFQTVSDFARDHQGHARRSRCWPRSRSTGGRNNHGRKTARHQRRRPQAALPRRRLPVGTRTACPAEGGRGRVRPQPQLPHPPAPLRRRREGLHPRPPKDVKVGDRPAVRPGLGDPSRQRPAAALHPRRHHACTTSSSAPVAAARWPARPASSVQLVAKEGDFATLRLP